MAKFQLMRNKQLMASNDTDLNQLTELMLDFGKEGDYIQLSTGMIIVKLVHASIVGLDTDTLVLSYHV